MSDKSTAVATRKAKTDARKKAVAEYHAKYGDDTDAGKEENQKRVIAELEHSAKEIEARIQAAARDEDKAWDHRLAASLILAEAKKTCEQNKINFKKWCETNLKAQSYETIRKLAAAGAGGEKKAVKAIEDMRARNALANKKLRERKKQKEQPAKRIDLVAAARAAVEQLTDKKQIALVSERAKSMGFEVVPAGKASETPTLGVAELKAAFAKLNPSARMAFVKWACEEVGGAFADTFPPVAKAAKAEAAHA